MAHAQTNLDQGKTPAQIFASDCAACHKPTRALANGKNRFALTEFLREHYTTSREQAAGLAAYVLGAGFGAKPANEPAPKTTKQEEETPGIPRPPKPIDEAAKPDEEPAGAEEPGGGRRRNDHRQANTRDRRRPQAEPAREPAAMAEPGVGEAPLLEPASTNAAGQAAAEPGGPAAVPRDDIPD
jgi:hypothetical protein